MLHGACAILDDHNNTLVQENQGNRVSWPTATATTITSLDLGIPGANAYLNNLPHASSLLGSNLAPYASYGADPNNKIPYAMEFNAGIQQQFSNILEIKLDYVDSLSRHQYINPLANTAMTPGPGPISLRQPFPQYGGPFSFEWNEGPGSYNALQAFLQKSLSSGLFFMASYTWSKSLDWASDPYNNNFPNFYDLASNLGPSNYSLKNMFVLSGVYALPAGRGIRFMSTPSGLVQSIIGNWNVGTIVTLESTHPFDVLAGADVANTGGPNQRAERTSANPYASAQNNKHWLNAAAFTAPAPYTFGNQRRNDLFGPAYRDVDFNAFKNCPLTKRVTLQFRAEFFNILNTTNYGVPVNNIQSSAFGQILGAAGPGREIQFAAKAQF